MSCAQLLLYLSPRSPLSVTARRNLEMVLSRYDAQSFRLEVLDAAADVLRAEADRIVFTPTLLLRSSDGENTGWLVGDLADRDAVVNLLALGGLQTAS